MDTLFAVFGRFHPLLLHLPIGLLIGLLALEALARLRRRPLPAEVTGVLVWLAALSAAVVAASGWTLGSEPDYVGDTLFWHRWSGVSLAVCALLAALAHRAAAFALYRGLLALSAPLLVLAGHFGSTMTHGAGFLTAPLRERTQETVPTDGAVEPVEQAATYAGPLWSRDVAPLLAVHCGRCHGADKRKGELALHTPAAVLAGGESGPALVAGDADASLLLQRVRLPLDDMDHMPPEGKPQPSADEIELLRAWIAAGATFDTAADVESAPRAPEPADGAPDSEESAAAPQPDAQALQALERELVHVEALPAGSNALWIDFAATAEAVDDASVARLVGPLREFVVELSLARTRVGDATAEFAADLPRLRRLDLRGTAVTDAGVAALARSATLAELVLAQTAVGDGALDALAELPALERAWLWRSSVSSAGLAELRRARPELQLDDGAGPDAAALEGEGELAFTSDRPLPDQAAGQARGLAPVNALCPVSGSPVNPEYAVVFDGRVVGFCCPNCPEQFWEDPAKFSAALE